MCMAIVKKANATLSHHMLRHCWRSNPDGGGFSYAENGELVFVKGLMTIEAFLAAYDEHEPKFRDKNTLIHFRIGTSGYKNADNTHPFRGKECAVIHNGIFFSQPSGEARSDTRMLIEDSADLLTKETVLSKLDAIGYYITRGNKVAFLFEDGEFALANKDSWEEHEGSVFSNLGYRGALVATR